MTNKPIPGFWWAILMFALMVVECLVLGEVIFSESEGPASTMMQIYFGAAIVTCLLQLVGILLVSNGKYRMGGLLQMIASAPHVLKLEGLIGVIGGSIAYSYDETSPESAE